MLNDKETMSFNKAWGGTISFPKENGTNGITILYDDIAIDNPSISIFLKAGFKEQYRTDSIVLLKKDL